MKKKSEDVHPSLVRLLAVAAEAKITGPAALAKALNQSEQTINNWGYLDRGVSREGAMLAQQRFKVSATWIRKGTGEKMVGDLPVEQPPAPPTDGRHLAAALRAFFRQLRPIHRTSAVRYVGDLAERLDDSDFAAEVAEEFERMLAVPAAPKVAAAGKR